MIEHELLLLGLLKESPKHGYQIKLKIREILSIFTGVELKSIYYPLRILEKKGLVTKHAGRQGKRPQRFVYELTPRGQARFDELLSKSLLDFKRPQFSLDLSLYFLHYIRPETAKRRLKARISVLKKLSRGLFQMMKSLKGKRDPLVHILEHDLEMVETESGFLGRFIGTF